MASKIVDEEALRAAMQRSLASPDLDMSTEEVNKFSKAFEEPEFRQLMADYMEEITDPQHRAEQESYIRQLEADQQVPSNKELLHPAPGFVIKTFRQAVAPQANENRQGGNATAKGSEREKIWMNVVKHEHIAAPESTAVEKGQNWSLPYCLGPMRVEADKKGSTVPTRDVCFHPDAIARAQGSQRFRDLLVRTAIEAWEGAPGPAGGAASAAAWTLERTYHVLRGVEYKTGTPSTLVLSKPASSPPSASQPAKFENQPGEAASASPAKAASPAAPAMKKGFLDKRSVKTQSKGPQEPHYTISYRGTFAMSDAMQSTSGEAMVVSRPRPRHLIVYIEVPKLQNARDMELDVASRELKFSVPDLYELHLPLPYAVSDTEGKAAFNKASSRLEVTLPVQPETAEEAAERREKERNVLRRGESDA